MTRDQALERAIRQTALKAYPQNPSQGLKYIEAEWATNPLLRTLTAEEIKIRFRKISRRSPPKIL